MGHDHAHGHSHDPNTYWSEQICTLGACGTLGIVAILITFQGALNSILTPTFHGLVLAAGITLVALTVIRGIVLWVEVGRPKEEKAHDHGACCGHHDDCHEHKHEVASAVSTKESASAEIAAAGLDSPSPQAVSLAVVAPPHEASHNANGHHHHDHSHDHSHNHSHDHSHNHGSGDGHQHGWAPWRYAVLLVPVVLYALGLPAASQGPSLNLVKSRLAQENLESNDFVTMVVAGDEVLPLEFNTLKTAAYMPDQRERYEGKMGKLKGQFVPGNDGKSFSLVRVKMTCCYADAMPLNVIIISKKDVPDFKPMQWVDVTGQIQFRKRQGRDEYLPVIQLRDNDGVTPTDPPANPYL